MILVSTQSQYDLDFDLVLVWVWFWVMLALISWGDYDADGHWPSNAARLIWLTRWRMGASRSDNDGRWGGLAWIPPPSETREFWQSSLGSKINFQVEQGS